MNILSNFKSRSLEIREWGCFDDIFTKDHSVGHLISDEAVRRTAPATPGLLNRHQCSWKQVIQIEGFNMQGEIHSVEYPGCNIQTGIFR